MKKQCLEHKDIVSEGCFVFFPHISWLFHCMFPTLLYTCSWLLLPLSCISGVFNTSRKNLKYSHEPVHGNILGSKYKSCHVQKIAQSPHHRWVITLQRPYRLVTHQLCQMHAKIVILPASAEPISSSDTTTISGPHWRWKHSIVTCTSGYSIQLCPTALWTLLLRSKFLGTELIVRDWKRAWFWACPPCCPWFL